MGCLSFSDVHVKKENMNVIFVFSFCHPVAEADLFDFVRFQICNGDLRVLSDVLSELRLIKQTKVFFIHNQIENVNNETVHVLVLLKIYICMGNL